MAGIYIHIPFCKQACHYCDFHFSTNLKNKQLMIEAIKQELVLQRNYLNEPVQTIYFGGGTPSILEASELNDVLETVSTNYNVTTEPEITLEANPDDLSFSQLDALKSIGINRLSIGIQSFDDEVLKFLNRAHNRVQVLDCIENARNAGFENISIDLIYGIPNRDHKKWLEDLDNVTAMNPEHISAYCLTIEPQTAFGKWAKKGQLKLVEDDYAAAQFDTMISVLSQHGFEQYEVSNFCRDSFYSTHNTSYWQQKPYLGAGPGAHSYNLESRQYNIRNNQKYINSLAEGIIPYDIEHLSKNDIINDYILTAIRTKWGIDLEKLAGLGYLNDTDYINSLVANELAFTEKNNLILTTTGKLLADKISSDLFIID
uniref:radical SAM family heme chaperone HemW n=1 Tax=Fulvivirga sp. TaxID=1931237 RepID=UPI00404A8551